MLTHKILIVDDHAIFRTGLRIILNTERPNIEVSETSSVYEALNISSNPFNVILLDIQMAGFSGIESIPLIKTKWPDAKILMLSSQDDVATKQLAIASGADGFVSKAETADKTLGYIDKLLIGNLNYADKNIPSSSTRSLTPRQLEVLTYLAQGLSNKIIAKRLNLSDNTIRRHVQDILEFLQVSNRTEAVFAARSQMLVP